MHTFEKGEGKTLFKFSISLMSTRKLDTKSIATLRNNAEGIKIEHSSWVTVPRNVLLNENGAVPSGLVEYHTDNHE